MHQKRPHTLDQAPIFFVLCGMRNDQITVVCPSCQTYFHVARSSLGMQGRTVRCNVCHKVWFERSHAQTPKPQPIPESATKKFIRSGQPVRNIERNAPPPYQGRPVYQTFPEDFTYRRRRSWRPIMIKALIVLCVGLALAGIGFGVTYYFTHSVSLNTSRGEFRTLQTGWDTHLNSNNQTVIVLRSSVANISDHSASPPTVHTVTRYKDASGEGMLPTTLQLTGQPLGPGEIRPFTTNLVLDRPATVTDVTCSVEH